MKSKEKRKEKIFVIKSKARKANLFNATVKEAKVKDLAILFLALSWFHQGNHKKLSFNISKSTLINFHVNIFSTYIVSLSGISFHNFYKNWDSLFKIKFCDVHITFGG